MPLRGEDLETLNFQKTHAMSLGNASFPGRNATKQSGEMLERARICNKSQPKFKELVQVDSNALGNINCNMIHRQPVYETVLG